MGQSTSGSGKYIYILSNNYCSWDLKSRKENEAIFLLAESNLPYIVITFFMVKQVKEDDHAVAFS